MERLTIAPACLRTKSSASCRESKRSAREMYMNDGNTCIARNGRHWACQPRLPIHGTALYWIPVAASMVTADELSMFSLSERS